MIQMIKFYYHHSAVLVSLVMKNQKGLPHQLILMYHQVYKYFNIYVHNFKITWFVFSVILIYCVYRIIVSI